jgi:hypothetical protein
MVCLGLPIKDFQFKNRSVYFGNKSWSRGVTTVIKNVFATAYTYNKLRMRHVCPKGLRKRRAVRRGHIIDNTIDRWVNGLSLKCRVKEPRMLIQLFESLAWKPIASQLVVAYPEARIATKIDIVLYDTRRDTLLIVEVKSGCHYRRCTTKDGTLQHIRPIVNDSPLHQHQLQSLIGKLLFLKTYPHWSALSVESVVVYVSTSGDTELLMESDFDVQYSSVIEKVILRTA